VARALLAVRFLTIVPVSRRGHAGLDDLWRAAPWFPVVGTGLGLALAAIDVLGIRVFPPLLAAVLTVAAWTLLTGGLHLDGLADCLDGLAGHDPAARAAIMRDSRLGAFGAMGLVLCLVLELAALAELPLTMRWRALVTAPVIARATPAVLGRLFRPARPDGLGALFCAGLGRAAVAAGLAVAIVVAVGLLGSLGLVALAVGVGAAVMSGAFLARRLGGVTGDVLGAGVVLTELAVFLTVSAWTYAPP
jgi:adenosylcobinamide-GDP ribazoletransferase